MRSKKTSFFLLLFISLSSKAAHITIAFYTEKIPFTSLANYTLEVPIDLDDIRLKAIADKWETQPERQKVAKQIDSVSRQLDLCPWFRYQLIVKYTDQCFPHSTANQKRMCEWYLLNKQGYDARIVYGKTFHVFVQLEKQVDTPHDYLELEGKRFFNLRKDPLPAYLISRFSMNGAKSSVFTLSDLRPPKLKNTVTQERKVKVRVEADSVTVVYKVNKTIAELYLDYPTGYTTLFPVELSETTRKSLLPELCSKLISSDTLESIRRLLAFTQNVARYEDDMKTFGHEKPMAPEEVLYHTYSDCEDRSALFYYLIKAFYGLPMIGLKYPTHVNVAIQLPRSNYRDIIAFKGKTYTVCEPTDLSRRAVLGESIVFAGNRRPSVDMEFGGASAHYNCQTPKP